MARNTVNVHDKRMNDYLKRNATLTFKLIAQNVSGIGRLSRTVR